MSMGSREILVHHPVKGGYLAEGVADKLEAAQRAAKAWGLQWSVVAKESQFYEQAQRI